MPEYQKYSRDIWDYIKDLPYMPSRSDREKLFLDEKRRERVQLWDYFFRIKPEDVGKPQREEISSIIKEIRESVEKCQQRDIEILEKIIELKRIALIKAIKRFVWGSIVLGVVIFLISRTLIFGNLPIQNKYIYGSMFSLIGLVILALSVGVGFIAGNEKKNIEDLALSLIRLKKALSEKIGEAEDRISALKKEVARLRRQVPKPISGDEARLWLEHEFRKLWDYAKTEVALVRNIIEIQGENPDQKIDNPLSVLGPGELQEKIPRQFLLSVNEDLHKHITAKQAYQTDKFYNENYDVMYDVIYGVYFFEYIVVATDMLVTHSFFYDFIEDKVTTEYTTEQYYTDVVALAIEKEFRELTTLNSVGKSISPYIADSPTFTLSLKSGEKHKVSFVNEDYFIKVRDKLDISLDDIEKIFWIADAKRIADNVIKALRSYLRKHKTL